ncbi:hypothetical protein C6341_g8711 [Phytophthora cactorum]|nr:hypothetical protein C6341_g8711 [Phytophthora cactorum]
MHIKEQNIFRFVEELSQAPARNTVSDILKSADVIMKDDYGKGGEARHVSQSQGHNEEGSEAKF